MFDEEAAATAAFDVVAVIETVDFADLLRVTNGCVGAGVTIPLFGTVGAGVAIPGVVGAGVTGRGVVGDGVTGVPLVGTVGAGVEGLCEVKTHPHAPVLILVHMAS